MKKIIVIVIVGLAIAATANATCRSSYVCDDYGRNCRYMDICDNALDLPSINLDPLPALPPVELKPLPSLDLPPLGTSQCEYMQVNGQWQNICW